MSKNLKLNETTGDLKITNNNLTFTSNFEENLAQKITTNLKTFFEEWFLDRTIGIPYFTDVFGKQKASDVNAIMINAITNIDGVNKIIEFTADFNGNNRTYKIEELVIESTQGETVTLTEVEL
jgi:stringent starvation protein B